MKMVSQIAAKMTIALVATCMLLDSRVRAEEICAFTSKQLDRLGIDPSQLFQSIEEKSNPVEALRSMRHNKPVYNSSQFMDFRQILSFNAVYPPVNIASELWVVIWYMHQYDFPNNTVFLCDGETFDSSNRKYQFSSRLEYMQLNEVVIYFYMDDYYTK